MAVIQNVQNCCSRELQTNTGGIDPNRIGVLRGCTIAIKPIRKTPQEFIDHQALRGWQRRATAACDARSGDAICLPRRFCFTKSYRWFFARTTFCVRRQKSRSPAKHQSRTQARKGRVLGPAPVFPTHAPSRLGCVGSGVPREVPTHPDATSWQPPRAKT